MALDSAEPQSWTLCRTIQICYFRSKICTWSLWNVCSLLNLLVMLNSILNLSACVTLYILPQFVYTVNATELFRLGEYSLANWALIKLSFWLPLLWKTYMAGFAESCNLTPSPKLRTKKLQYLIALSSSDNNLCFAASVAANSFSCSWTKNVRARFC